MLLNDAVLPDKAWCAAHTGRMVSSVWAAAVQLAALGAHPRPPTLHMSHQHHHRLNCLLVCTWNLTRRMTAYAGALHEHCAALLEYGGPTDCSSSVRCVYLRPDGSTNSSSSHTSQVNASFLAATNSSSSSGGRPGHATAAFWRSVAPVLRLEQPACVLLPVSLDSVRYRACASAQPPASPDAVAQHCQESPAACFVRNASDAADFESWWLGPSPQQHLEDSSSWKDAGRLQRVASECMQAWAAKGKLVTDTCATRGIGASPWNNSLMLNRVLVALVDAFESSGCNNTVTYSEAMAVQRILDDLCTSTPGCKAAQAASAGAAAARLSLLPVLGVTVLAGWWVVVAP